jgi:putative ABC transport system permease protein
VVGPRAATQIGPFFAEAYDVLARNKLRSFLTILGLIIGVAAVIAIEILGKGTAGAVDGLLGSLNDHSFFLFPAQRQADFSKAQLTFKEVERVTQLFPNVVVAIPAGNVQRLVSSGHHHARLGIASDSDVSFAAVPLAYGRNLSHDDVASAARVCVLGDNAYRRLFPDGGDPVGTTLRIGERRYAIVGVQGAPTQGIIPFSFGGDVTIPYTSFAHEYLRARPVYAARFVVADATRIGATERDVVAYFKGIKAGNADYQTFDRKSFATTVDGIFTALTLVIALIGAISLLVAGIGIMNMMLVSVSERTREIGVRKAIGATSGQVLLQFFIEALLLSVIGCGAGLVLGLVSGAVVDRYALVKVSGIVPSIPWLQSVAIAVGFATLVTLLFGTYPAYRAAKLDPIEALRYE